MDFSPSHWLTSRLEDGCRQTWHMWRSWLLSTCRYVIDRLSTAQRSSNGADPEPDLQVLRPRNQISRPGGHCISCQNAAHFLKWVDLKLCLLSCLHPPPAVWMNGRSCFNDRQITGMSLCFWPLRLKRFSLLFLCRASWSTETFSIPSLLFFGFAQWLSWFGEHVLKGWLGCGSVPVKLFLSTWKVSLVLRLLQVTGAV